MPRLGMNPNRTKTAAPIPRIVLTVITHLPNQEGYHQHRLEVIKTCLKSMRVHADMPHAIAIWDNGSCPELREWLSKVYQPDFLITSHNVGKTQARLMLAKMFAGHIIACADDDIYFERGWLKPQVDLLCNFPNASCVTGYPVRTSFRWGNQNTKLWGSVHGKMKSGRFIPDKWEEDFAVSIGRDIQEHKRMTVADVDYLVEWKGIKAYATSHHCQFVARANDVLIATQKDNGMMSDEKPFDIEMDRLGLRLSTTERLTRHMGNYIDDTLRGEIS